MLRAALLSLLFTLTLFAEDFMLGHQYKDENFYLPPVPQSMSFEEFNLLSLQVGAKEMLYSAIVPGYMHYKAQEYTAAYTLATIRLASYVTMAYLSFDSTLVHSNVTQGIMNGAIAAALISYAYDYIVGENILEHKQNQLRYKYSIQAVPTAQGGIQSSIVLSARF